MNSSLSSKIYQEFGDLQPTLKLWKEEKKSIVFTNGCFDIIHAGHVQYLEHAKNLGDILIIALNADDSVKRLKGPKRPINNTQNRAIVLAALQCVDAVIVFEEDTPFSLIQAILPHILVKGSDWPTENIIGADIVLSHGGKVLSLPYHEGLSTTEVIRKSLL